MNHKFDTALDDCLDLLRSGIGVEDCLARHPEHAEDLRALLNLAFAVKRVPTPRPDPAAVDANRRRMIDTLRQQGARRHRRAPFASGRAQGPSSGPQAWPIMRTVLVLAGVILLVSLGAGVLHTFAADSLPGQALYPVKRFSEDVRLSLTLNPAARQELQAGYEVERQREVWRVLDAGGQAVLEFRGELTEIGDGYFLVAGLRVIVDNNTLVEGRLTAGAIVAVRALSTADGSLRALTVRLEADPVLLTAVVTATPTPTPSSTPTATPAPSATPSTTPVPSPTPSTTPVPSATPAATASPLPTATATPTQTAEPESTDLPDEDETEEPEPTGLPEDDDTAEPDAAGLPDAANPDRRTQAVLYWPRL